MLFQERGDPEREPTGRKSKKVERWYVCVCAPMCACILSNENKITLMRLDRSLQ